MFGMSSPGRMSSATSPPGSATPFHHFQFTGANSIRVIIQIGHGTIPGRQQPSQSRTRTHNGFKGRTRLVRLIRPIRLPRSNPRGATSPPGKLKNSLSVLVVVGKTTHQANVNCLMILTNIPMPTRIHGFDGLNPLRAKLGMPRILPSWHDHGTRP